MAELVRRIAFEDRSGNFVFVKVPDEYGRYVRTSWLVTIADCPHCKSLAGEPCKRASGKSSSSTHADRIVAAWKTLREAGVNVQSASVSGEEHPIIREDVLHADECPECHGVPRHFSFNCAGEVRETVPECKTCGNNPLYRSSVVDLRELLK